MNPWIRQLAPQYPLMVDNNNNNTSNNPGANNSGGVLVNENNGFKRDQRTLLHPLSSTPRNSESLPANSNTVANGYGYQLFQPYVLQPSPHYQAYQNAPANYNMLAQQQQQQHHQQQAQQGQRPQAQQTPQQGPYHYQYNVLRLSQPTVGSPTPSINSLTGSANSANGSNGIGNQNGSGVTSNSTLSFGIGQPSDGLGSNNSSNSSLSSSSSTSNNNSTGSKSVATTTNNGTTKKTHSPLIYDLRTVVTPHSLISINDQKPGNGSNNGRGSFVAGTPRLARNDSTSEAPPPQQVNGAMNPKHYAGTNFNNGMGNNNNGQRMLNPAPFQQQLYSIPMNGPYQYQQQRHHSYSGAVINNPTPGYSLSNSALATSSKFPFGDDANGNGTDNILKKGTGANDITGIVNNGTIPSEQDTSNNKLTITTLTNSDNSSPSNFIHKCHLCEKSFKRRSWLKRHLLSHSAERHYLCPWCLSRHKRKDNLLQHMKLKHSNYLLDELKNANVSFNWGTYDGQNSTDSMPKTLSGYPDSSIKKLLYRGILNKDDVKRVLNKIIERSN
ncbi:Mot3p KNAG_0C05810 [Huiozyma naganishii CBS 8797]|uniref:C2H2-type domain-containing protein n=1 Tax=Huiozyma naganishii (strain ATCC MYA-139 / BCRC 22969 / CBS 8797 / KCTC 17520 / NBRC 10181 / NCYC 3082 / Yp74L-3) TaxID=1071383 RepID=J7S557_HUIN7|nr:hypothetical protein KNAG_0C05810 [Kazachstania naganishii CBS 8797]CCK69679.1 hypothetical protein KNAG_0C05810 [Kazachstania naganishii CBS 8797]